MDKYAQMKMFYHDPRIQLFMYAFMRVETETMAEEVYLPDTKLFFENYKRRSTPGILPRHWLGFSYISSEEYELDLKVGET